MIVSLSEKPHQDEGQDEGQGYRSDFDPSSEGRHVLGVAPGSHPHHVMEIHAMVEANQRVQQTNEQTNERAQKGRQGFQTYHAYARFFFLPAHFHEFMAWPSSSGSRTDVLWRQSLWLWAHTGGGGCGRKSERIKGSQVEHQGEVSRANKDVYGRPKSEGTAESTARFMSRRIRASPENRQPLDKVKKTRQTPSFQAPPEAVSARFLFPSSHGS